MNIQTMKMLLTNSAKHTRIVLQKNSPQILMGTGVVGIVGATVLACRATLAGQDVLYQASAMKAIFDTALEKEDEYTRERYNKDLAVMAAITFVELVKLYGPAVILGTLSLGMMLRSNNILNKRNASLLAAYKTIDEAYKRYRGRVREELGEDIDRYFATQKRDGRQFKVTVKEGDEEKDFTLNEKDPEIDLEGSVYAKVFDSSSPQWRKDNQQNLFFLRSQQNYANVSLQAQGCVFLNEIYDMLGLPRTSAGAIVGWVKDSPIGDGVISFGVFDSVVDNADFFNGYSKEIVLDFNVDGVIYDLI